MLKNLIKCFLIVFLLFVTSITAYAFNEGNKYWVNRVSVGTASYNYFVERSYLVNNNWVYETEKKDGDCFVFGGGLGVNYFFIDNFAFTIELNMELNHGDLKHLSIPMGVNYFFGQYFFVGGGLYYGGSESWRYSHSDARKTSGFHLGILVDGGLAFELAGRNMLRIFGRYNYGFEDVIEPRILSLNVAVGFFF